MPRILSEKLKESATSILPIGAIVLLLALTIAPLPSGTFLLFAFGVVFLILGMAVFTMGAEMSMQPLGTKIGTTVASTGKIWLIAFVSFVIGVVVTVSEPDLQILAHQISDVPNWLLILTVSIGVGIFLVIALLHIVFNIPLTLLLTLFYSLAFVLCLFVPDTLYAIAFDSGGVTTGPMTVPFLMALGAGVSSARSKQGRDDSFSIISLCSIGPILSVLILGLIVEIGGGDYVFENPTPVVDTREGVLRYLGGFGEYAVEVMQALLPIVVFTVFFQLLTRAFGKKQLIRIAVGILYTFLGLTVFLAGANIGFIPIGYTLGTDLAGVGSGLVLIPVSMLLGFFIVKAEPSVYVLNKQVEHMTAGAISGRTLGLGLSLGVASALGLSVVRILTGISIMYILIPGYAIAILLSFFVPKIFVGIAFDSGGVASGTMMSAFVLPLAIGACTTLGENVMTQAFGCVAFVALTPIISLEICGWVYVRKQKSSARRFISEQETFIDYDACDAAEAL